MKKTVGIALITLGLTSCGSTNYLPCPAYGSNTNHETEGIHENLTEEEYNELVDLGSLSAHGQENDYYYELDCENCDETD